MASGRTSVKTFRNEVERQCAEAGDLGQRAKSRQAL
jgi:hypothetical protein